MWVLRNAVVPFCARMNTVDNHPKPSLQHIFRWDLDKTYLATDFDSIPDLLRTFVQKPEEKINIPGADALLRELLLDTDRRIVTFISGSPQQMRNVLEEKLRLDGIDPAFFVLKPNLQNLLRGRFRALRGQIGYKLEALLDLRCRTALAPETLFGDDSEQDAFIYSLYGDIINGRLGRAFVKDLLKQARVYPDTAERILSLIRDNPIENTTKRIFINLERHTPTARFMPYGGRLVPIHNYFQAALVLFDDGTLDADSILRVAFSMTSRHRFTPAMLANSFQDLIRRRRLAPQVATRMAQELQNASMPEAIPVGLTPKPFIAELTRQLHALGDREDIALLGDVGTPDYSKLLVKALAKRH